MERRARLQPSRDAGQIRRLGWSLVRLRLFGLVSVAFAGR